MNHKSLMFLAMGIVQGHSPVEVKEGLEKPNPIQAAFPSAYAYALLVPRPTSIQGTPKRATRHTWNPEHSTSCAVY